jgi:pectate lyase
VFSRCNAALEGIGLTILNQKNVIVRNMKISKVEADYGDAITIQKTTNVWVDHCDLSATREGDKDFYDGLTDLSHAADWVTVSHTYFHDHVSKTKCAYLEHQLS